MGKAWRSGSEYWRGGVDKKEKSAVKNVSN